jgi:hypothetical protein
VCFKPEFRSSRQTGSCPKKRQQWEGLEQHTWTTGLHYNFIFETGTQAGLELTILLPPPPERWNPKGTSPSPAPVIILSRAVIATTIGLRRKTLYFLGDERGVDKGENARRNEWSIPRNPTEPVKRQMSVCPHAKARE